MQRSERGRVKRARSVKRSVYLAKKGGRRSRLWPHVNFSAVARSVGVSHSHLCNIVAGRQRPSLKVALELAEVWSVILGKRVTAESLVDTLKKGLSRYTG